MTDRDTKINVSGLISPDTGGPSSGSGILVHRNPGSSLSDKSLQPSHIRRPSIYDDLPVSMASRLNYPEMIEDIESVGGESGTGGDVESGYPPSPLIGQVESGYPPSPQIGHFTPMELAPSPQSLSGKQRDSGSGDGKTGPIQKLFKPFFVKFWTPTAEKDHEDKREAEVAKIREKQRQDKPEITKKRIISGIYGKVIEEVDPFVFEDTFCVLTRKFGKDYICRYSATRTLFIFGPLNYIRRLSIYIISHPIFDILIMLTILANCVSLAFDTKKVIKQKETGQYIVEDVEQPRELELTFMVIYSVEMILKVIAKGFILNKFSYLRNGWNILDFLVVLLAYFTDIQFNYSKEVTTKETNDTIQILRTFRVLRAIKTISILPGLRMMINALINAITQLMEVMLLTFFCLCIFSLFALEIFMGKFHQVCVVTKGSPSSNRMALADGNLTVEPIIPGSPNADYEFRSWIHNPMNWLRRSFPKNEFMVCSNDTGARSCPQDYSCLPDLAENPDNGWTSFDHFGLSMLSTLQLLTLDYWERLYELVMSSVGPWSIFFFLGVIFFGSFYLLNLMLAVVAMSYEAEAQCSVAKPLSKHQKLTLHRSHSTFSFEEPFKLDIKPLSSGHHRRSPAERMALAKKLRTATLGKRKKRRAFRRKVPPNKPNSGGIDMGGGNSLGGTGGVPSPDLRSGGGSLSGSLYSAYEGGGPVSPVPLRRRPKTNKILMSGVLGERPSAVQQHSSKSRSAPPVSVSTKPKAKRIVTIDEGDRVVNVISKRYHPSGTGVVIEKGFSVDSGVGDMRASGGGIRVSARVKSRDEDEIEETHDLSLEQAEHKYEDMPKAGGLQDTIMNMLGRRITTAPHARLQSKSLGGSTAAGGDDDFSTHFRSHHTLPEGPVIKIQEEPSIISVPVSITSHESSGEKKQFRSRYNVDRTQTQDLRHLSETAQVISRMKSRLDPIVTHWGFESFITTCIIINTLLLASEHHGQPPWLTEAISTGSHCFTAVFTCECILKIVALQKAYFTQPWNLFDLTMVFISFADIILDNVLADSGGGFAFRVFRLLRIFKLAQSWITMKVLLNIIFSTFGALGNLTLVLVIFIYIFAILGMQILGDGFLPKNFELETIEDEDYPRWHYQDFWHAFMMIFRVIAQEWIEPLGECLDAHDGGGEWRCFIIYIPVLIFGTFIVLNLFLALLLNSFNSEELKAQRDKEKELSGKSDTLKSIVGMLIAKNRRAVIALPAIVAAATEHARTNITRPSTPSNPQSLKSLPRHEQAVFARRMIMRQKFMDAAHKIIMKNRKAAAIRAIRRAEEGMNDFDKTHLHPDLNLVKNPLLDRTKMADAEQLSINSIEDTTLANCLPEFLTRQRCAICTYIRKAPFVKWTRFRTFCLKIVSNNVFEWTILVLILGSSITLCFEDVHLEEKPSLKLTLFILNTVFTTIFVIEMILKWIALGLVKYFTSFWTLLDVFIVTISVVSLGFDISSRTWEPLVAKKKSAVSSLKALRTLRALRPLRAISRWQGMKVVVNALMYAIPSIFNVLLVCLLFWLIFAIMGVQFFKGKFFKCINGETGVQVASAEVANKVMCCEQRSDTVWINTTPNFDNVFEAYLSLFQVATFEGWMELMKAASDIDSSGNDLQPKRDSSYYANIYFVVFIIFGTFFTLNLFIGVIIDNFNMLKKKYEGNLVEALLTPSQMRYYTAMKKLGRKKPQRVIRRPRSKFLALFYDISMSRRFEIAIFVLIFLNMVVMAFEHHGQREIFHHILTGFNSFFSTIYALEAIVKIIGMRQYYFTIPWNVFDFCLVLFSILDLFLTDVQWSLPFPPTMLRVVRVFRIGRVLRLIKAAKGIRKLLFALVVSLPALFNIGALLALITFIYAILGMALFKEANFYGTMDEMFNFKTFPRSFMMLLRLMTAAGWNDVLNALVVEIPECNIDSYRKLTCGKDDEPECVSRMVSVSYMVSYIIITNLIVINMYIAIILENFVEANEDEEIGIVEDDLEMFYIRWSRYDPTATQFIGFDQLSEFLASLDPPLDIPRPNIVAIVAFNLPIARGNKIHCLDILHALVKHALGHVDDSEEFRKIQEQMEAKFRKQFPSRKLLDIVSSTRIWKIQHNAAVIIQRCWRAYRNRKYAVSSATQQSTQTVTSTRNAHHGFGHKLGQFFHVGSGDKRRRSSLRDGLPIPNKPISGSLKRGSPLPVVRDEDHFPLKSRSSIVKQELDELPSAYPRSSYSSQSSSSASPLPVPRIIETQGNQPSTSTTVLGDQLTKRQRRLSPSRLSGGSFDVAVNFGIDSPPLNSRLLAIYLPKSMANINKSNTQETSRLPPPSYDEVVPGQSHIIPMLSVFSHPQCITYSSSPFHSGPTSPASPPPTTLNPESRVVVQIHENSSET